MKLSAIVAEINRLLAGELLSYPALKGYLDRTIDDINTHLQSKFPAFSELDLEQDEYNYFPDRYIRQVVCVGAAWYYFISDEEGINTAPEYGSMYQRGLFFMVRDYFNQVPEEYQQTEITPLREQDGERGISVYGPSIIP